MFLASQSTHAKFLVARSGFPKLDLGPGTITWRITSTLEVWIEGIPAKKGTSEIVSVLNCLYTLRNQTWLNGRYRLSYNESAISTKIVCLGSTIQRVSALQRYVEDEMGHVGLANNLPPGNHPISS